MEVAAVVLGVVRGRDGVDCHPAHRIDGSRVHARGGGVRMMLMTAAHL
jgi:hypothetical protein